MPDHRATGPGSSGEFAPLQEADYRRFFETAVEGLYRITAEGRLVFANRALARMAGFETPEEIVAATTDITEQFYAHAEDRARFQELIRREGIVRGFETQMRRRDGSLGWVSVDAHVFRDAAGRVYFDGAIRDITERKQTEEAWRTSETRFRTTLGHLKEGCMIIGPDWRYLYLNEVAARHGRKTVAELLGRRMTDVYPGVEGTAIFAAYQASLRDRQPREIESEFRHADGTTAWYQLMIEPVPEGIFVLSQEITARKLSDLAAARLSAIVQHSDDAIIGKDVSGIITTWNPGAEKIFGHTAAEAIGRPMLIIFPPERHAEEEQILGRIVRGERVQHYETVRVRKDGRRIDVSATISPILDGAGRVVGASKIVRDISVRKNHEREIARLARLYAALSHVSQAVAVTPVRGELFGKVCRILVETGGFRMSWIGCCDPATSQVVPAASHGDVSGYVGAVPIYADERPEGRGPTGTAIREARNFICNDFFHDPRTEPWRAGATRAGFQASAVFPFREGGRVSGALSVYAEEAGYFQDKEIALLDEVAAMISFALDNLARDEARRRAEEEVRLSEERFRTVVENIREVLWLRDVRSGRMLYISPGYEAIWGRTCESLYRSAPAWIDTVHPDDRGRMQEATQSREAPAPFDETYRIVRPDGTLRWIRARSFPVKAASSAPALVVGLAEDVTAEREMEAKLLHNQRLEVIGTLSSGIAHDLNNILAPMLMATGLLRHEISDARQRELLGMMETGARRGASIIRQLLTFSRGIEGQRVPVQPRHLFKEIVELARETFPRNITVADETAHDLGLVLADPTQLHQVLMNLCVNARDAMPGGGTLRLSVRNAQLAAGDLPHPEAKAGPYVVLVVADSGEGIPAGIVERIFDPFFTTKPVGKGTGLGLATAAGIVKSHGGFITVRSAPAQGAMFEVYLPLLTESTAPVAVADGPAAPRGGGECILVVDDEAAIRSVVCRTLERANFRALRAVDGPEALAIMQERRHEIRLAIVDLMMPAMSGGALAGALRALNPQLPIIAMSGLVPDDQRAELSALGVTDILMKPFQIDDMLRRVSTILPPG